MFRFNLCSHKYLFTYFMLVIVNFFEDYIFKFKSMEIKVRIMDHSLFMR